MSIERARQQGERDLSPDSHLVASQHTPPDKAVDSIDRMDLARQAASASANTTNSTF